MNRRAKDDAKQEELALSSVASHVVFPGRTTLYVSEVAKALCISIDQVIRLIADDGALVAINISASRSAGRTSAEMTEEERRRVPRSHWRIPVSAYDSFLDARKSTAAPAA